MGSPMVRLTLWGWLASLAACLSLAPLVTGVGFIVSGAIASALLVGVAAVGRHQRAPVTLVLVVQLFVLLEWATLTYAPEEAWSRLLPTRESLLALVDLVRSALDTAEQYAPPAPGYEGVDMSLALVIAGVALVVDLMAVTWRRPALVGLVFLGVYMAPVSLLAGEVPLTAFVPGALAFVFLLGAEQRDRLTHWGRQIGITSSLLSERDRDRVRVATLVQSGRRVGLGAVALAVVLPLLVPTMPRTFLAEGPLTGGGGSGGGDGTVDIENPMLDLQRNLGERTETVLVTMTTNGPTPSYLRIASLDEFTGEAWQPGPRTDETSVPVGQVPAPPGLITRVARSRISAEVALSESFRTTWLPTLYPTSDLTGVSGDWGIDLAELDVSAREVGVNGAGTTYRLDSTQLLPSTEQLIAAPATPAEDMDMSRYLELADAPPVVSSLAAEVTAGERTPFEQAEALQDWFRSEGGFEYSLDSATGTGLETIEDFLQGERVGYCEQFAAAMALMARSLDIPARVAVGFLRPEQASDGSWEFQGVDMHAWPELFFEGIGWVRFEPTPASRTGAAPDFEAVPTESAPDNAADPNDSNPTESPRTPRPDAAPGAAGGGDGGGPGLLLPVAGGALVLLLVLGPRSLRAARRTSRWRQARAGHRPVAEAAWAELTDLAVDLGVRVDRATTLRTTGRGLRSRVDDDPAAVTALNRLVVEVERSRFARGGAGRGRTVEDSGRDVDLVTGRLAAGCRPAHRWRARWVPVSLLPSRPQGGWGWSGQPATGSGMLLQAEDQPRGG